MTVLAHVHEDAWGMCFPRPDALAGRSSLPGTRPPNTYRARTVGIEVEVAAGGGDAPRHWLRKYDGSLPDTGSEYVSAPYPAVDSAALQAVYATIRDTSHADASCGVHIHVGSRPLTALDAMHVFEAASRVWRVLAPRAWACIPEDQHSGRRQYARHYESLRPEDRYQDLNISSLRRHGTVEYRHLPATLTSLGRAIVACVATTEAIEHEAGCRLAPWAMHAASDAWAHVRVGSPEFCRPEDLPDAVPGIGGTVYACERCAYETADAGLMCPECAQCVDSCCSCDYGEY